MYSFSYLEPVCCSMSSSNCCFLICIQTSQEADQVVCLLRNLYAGQEATVRTGHGTINWFQIGKGVHQGCLLSPCLCNFYAEWKVKVAQLCLILCDPRDYSPWNSSGQNTGVGKLTLLQGIFPTQGSNPGLLRCRQILHQLSYQGSPLLHRSPHQIWVFHCILS